MASFGELLDAAKRTNVCLSDLPGFIPPLQVRTQKKTDIIVSSTALLLQERSFEAISIQDIATLADCSVTSIYARFVDKEAILPAVNLIIMEHYRPILMAALFKSRIRDVDSICKGYVYLNNSYYRDHANFIKASAIIKSDYIFRQMNEFFREPASVLNFSISEATGISPEKSLSSVEFGVQQVHSNFRDRIVCGDLNTFDHISLVRLLSAIIQLKIH